LKKLKGRGNNSRERRGELDEPRYARNTDLANKKGEKGLKNRGKGGRESMCVQWTRIQGKVSSELLSHASQGKEWNVGREKRVVGEGEERGQKKSLVACLRKKSIGNGRLSAVRWESPKKCP